MFSIEEIKQPVSDSLPEGKDFSLSGELLELESMAKPVLPTNAEGKRIADDFSEHEPDWARLEARCEDLLRASRDLRIAVPYCAALLRAHGFSGLAHGVEIIRCMLLATEYRVHPQYEPGDTGTLLERWYTLAALSAPYKQEGDLFRIIEGIRALPLGKAKAGACRYSDVLAAKNKSGGADTAALDKIRSEWKKNSSEDRLLLTEALTASLGALIEIEKVVLEQTPESAIPVGSGSRLVLGLLNELKGLQDFLNGSAGVAAVKSQSVAVAASTANGSASTATSEGDGAPVVVAAPVAVPGEITSRADAIRLLEQVAEYFRKTEPASPVPYFVDRAVRLVDRDFMALLGELVPDAVPRFQSLAGVEEKQNN